MYRKLTVLIGLICLPVLAAAEEGMWTLDNPPGEVLQKKYDFTPTPEWLEKVRLASVRFNDGGSGSFVSPHGLVVTNHHVAVGQLQKMSSAERDYVEAGYYARELKDEIKCKDLEINVLMSMEDVTKRVLAAVKKGMNKEKALKARRAARARIEKESLDKTGLRSEVVSLYHGGQYWLYQYKKYTDVRLVMAPERQVAFWGGDSDNFTYPRYDLDVAFVRVYENDKPVSSKHYFKWNQEGAARGELVFITGHPGSTDRLDTMAQLEINRDLSYGLRLELIDRFLEAMNQFSRRGEEQARKALFWQFALANAKKALGGEYRALKDPELMGQRRKAEQELRAKVKGNPKWKKRFASAWDQVEKVLKKHVEDLRRQAYQQIFLSKLATKAINIVKYVHEIKKPDADRLDGFHDSELEELKFKLFSPAPIYKDMEAEMMEVSFRLSLEKLGKKDPYAKILLSLGDPHEAAVKLANQTKLDDVKVRKQLFEGGVKAVEQSKDPLIVLARKLFPILVKNEKWKKKHVKSVTTPAGEKIAQARFAVYGKNAYPDATFTLRMTYGTIKGYPMNGTQAPYKTTLYGLYDRAEGFDYQGPWGLPKRFIERRKQLELSTPVNFVCDCDITGGNSGSPVINRKAELVGVVFDGNIESLSGQFLFDPKHNRAVSVHSAYVLEALEKIYEAHDLADELLGNR